jgi:flavin reductase (DIM6/NTAB) family NADH-FMN oxidoreductase RutF
MFELVSASVQERCCQPNDTMIVDPKETPVPKFHSLLLGAVVPRPIAFVSSMDARGNVNLSPFSFFNVFSTNPPVMVFSPSRRGRDKTTKHTFDNVRDVPEVVINMVSYKMVEQASLSSGDYPQGVNEFVKAGFTEEKSERVRPPRVRESPVSFECKVTQVIELGQGGSAGNLVICEVLLLRVHDEVMDAEGRIDPVKLDAVARMGQEYYCRVVPESIISVPRPGNRPGIGFEWIPDWVRNEPGFTANELARLASMIELPGKEEIDAFRADPGFEVIASGGQPAITSIVSNYLKAGRTGDAWKVILALDRSEG